MKTQRGELLVEHVQKSCGKKEYSEEIGPKGGQSIGADRKV